MIFNKNEPIKETKMKNTEKHGTINIKVITATTAIIIIKVFQKSDVGLSV